jgi:hypothetical protein
MTYTAELTDIMTTAYRYIEELDLSGAAATYDRFDDYQTHKGNAKALETEAKDTYGSGAWNLVLDAVRETETARLDAEWEATYR